MDICLPKPIRHVRQAAIRLCKSGRAARPFCRGLEGLLGEAGPAGGWAVDLTSALTNLGFKEDQVLPIVKGLAAEQPPLAIALRMALKALQK